MDSPDPNSSSPYACHHADDSDTYDSDGQPKWGGVGQGAPLDENGRYIYSQIGMPVVPSPSPPLPSHSDATYCYDFSPLS